MNNEYLMPANSKKSQLILGFFTPLDLGIASVGGATTLLLAFLISRLGLLATIISLLPALIATVLCFPVPHYHNVRQLLTNVYYFYMNNRKFYWKGWCLREYGESD